MLKKAELMVGELGKFGISIAGISETRWFGNKVYKVGGCTILTSGRPVPDVVASDHAERGEGVGLVLDKWATEAWREGGEDWRQ